MSEQLYKKKDGLLPAPQAIIVNWHVWIAYNFKIAPQIQVSVLQDLQDVDLWSYVKRHNEHWMPEPSKLRQIEWFQREQFWVPWRSAKVNKGPKSPWCYREELNWIEMVSIHHFTTWRVTGPLANTMRWDMEEVWDTLTLLQTHTLYQTSTPRPDEFEWKKIDRDCPSKIQLYSIFIAAQEFMLDCLAFLGWWWASVQKWDAGILKRVPECMAKWRLNR